MASAVVQPLFRPLPLDHPLRPSSADFIGRNHSAIPDQRGTSTLPPPLLFGRELSRPPSTSNMSIFSQPQYHNRSASLSVRRMEECSNQQVHRPALPGLAELASLASSASARSFPMGTVPAMDQSMQPIPTPTISGLTNAPVAERHQVLVVQQKRDIKSLPLQADCGLHGSMQAYRRPLSTIGLPRLRCPTARNLQPLQTFLSLIPVCQNCQTSTTPLWRRDEAGSVLCNACGLFLKLHGRPRPISLKTDVIKSRNRVKSANQGQKKKFDHGLPASQSEMVTSQNGITAHRRVSQMAASVASDRSHSPISRTHTPTGHDPNIAPQHLFDGVTLSDHTFQSPSLPSLHLGQPSPGSGSHDRHLDTSVAYDQLVAANTVLKTRVSELEVINMMYSDNENNLRNERDAAIRAQDELKRRVRELEEQLLGERASKKPRLSESPTSTLR